MGACKAISLPLPPPPFDVFALKEIPDIIALNIAHLNKSMTESQTLLVTVSFSNILVVNVHLLHL